MVTGDKLLAGWLFNPHTNTWSTLDPPGAVTNCAVSMTAQAGALVALCTVDTVPVAVLRLPGETTWRSYPLPSGITASPNVVWTGKRLFIWGGAFPSTTMCPPPTPETAPMPSARAPLFRRPGRVAQHRLPPGAHSEEVRRRLSVTRWL